MNNNRARRLNASSAFAPSQNRTSRSPRSKSSVAPNTVRWRRKSGPSRDNSDPQAGNGLSQSLLRNFGRRDWDLVRGFPAQACCRGGGGLGILFCLDSFMGKLRFKATAAARLIHACGADDDEVFG